MSKIPTEKSCAASTCDAPTFFRVIIQVVDSLYIFSTNRPLDRHVTRGVKFSKLPNIISEEHFMAMPADLFAERLNALHLLVRTVIIFDSFETKGMHTV
jgi:hypothetical protein